MISPGFAAVQMTLLIWYQIDAVSDNLLVIL